MPRTRAETRLIREEEKRRKVEEKEKERRKAEKELPHVLLLLANLRCGKIPIEPNYIIDHPETYLGSCRQNVD